MAFGNAAVERAAIELTYEDTCDILRSSPKTADSGIATAAYAPVYTGVICALSYSSGDGSRQTRAQQDIDYEAVVFAPPDIRVLPGDRVKLRRFGRDSPQSGIILNFEVIGRPPVYATHQQIRVKDGDLS